APAPRRCEQRRPLAASMGGRRHYREGTESLPRHALRTPGLRARVARQTERQVLAIAPPPNPGQHVADFGRRAWAAREARGPTLGRRPPGASVARLPRPPRPPSPPLPR